MLVYTEVSQMDEPFAGVLRLGVILVCGESSEAFFEHVDPQGIVTSNHNIHSQVVFEIVYEVWVSYILRY